MDSKTGMISSEQRHYTNASELWSSWLSEQQKREKKNTQKNVERYLFDQTKMNPIEKKRLLKMKSTIHEWNQPDFDRQEKAKKKQKICSEPSNSVVNDPFYLCAGLDQAIEMINEGVLLPLLYPELFTHLSICPPRGILLHGRKCTKIHEIA
jgi:hypothetical protein